MPGRSTVPKPSDARAASLGAEFGGGKGKNKELRLHAAVGWEGKGRIGMTRVTPPGKKPRFYPLYVLPWSAEVAPVVLGLAKTQLGCLKPPPVGTAGTRQGMALRGPAHL